MSSLSERLELRLSPKHLKALKRLKSYMDKSSNSEVIRVLIEDRDRYIRGG